MNNINLFHDLLFFHGDHIYHTNLCSVVLMVVVMTTVFF